MPKLFVSLLLLGGISVAQIPSSESRQGVPLVVKFSSAVPNASNQKVNLVFSLYSSLADQEPRWKEVQEVELDDDGRFVVLLGSATPGGIQTASFSSGAARFVGIGLEGGEEFFRIRLVSVPYALKAASADSLGEFTASDFVLTRAARERLSARPSGQSSSQVVQESLGTVSSSSNSVGAIAKFVGTDSVGDSVITETGGRIGIGKIATEALDVNGAIRFGAGTFTPGVAKFYVDSQHGTLLTASAGSSNDLALVATTGQLLLTNPHNTNDLSFASGGKFGVNILNPSEPLHVNGAIRFGVGTYDVGIPKLFVSAQHGSVLSGTTGSLNDLAIASATGQLLLTNPTGSNNLAFFAPSGKFGVGTLSPTQTMDVVGVVRSRTGGFMFPDGSTQTTAALRRGPRPGDSLVCEGDSIMAAIAEPGGSDICTWLWQLHGQQGITKYNFSAPGRIADLVSRYSASVYPLRPAVTGVGRAYLWLNIGVNDIGSGGDGVETANAILNYARTARADGFTVVLNTVYLPIAFSATQAQQMNRLNTMLRNSADAWDYLVDIAQAISRTDVPGTFLPDGSHPSTSTTILIARQAFGTLQAGYGFGTVTSTNDLALGISEKSGIGTQSPATKLDVWAPSTETALISNEGQVSITNSDLTTANTHTSLLFRNRQASLFPLGKLDFQITNSGTAAALCLSKNYAIGITHCPLIATPAGTGGRVGIGNLAPSFPLDVAGEVRSSQGGFVFPDGTVQSTASGGANGLVLRATDNPSVCYRITVNAAGTLSANSIICPQ